MAKARKADNGSTASQSSPEIIDTIRGLAAVVAEHSLSELIVETAGSTITLRRGGAMPLPMPAMPAMSMQLPIAAPVAHAPAATPTAPAAAPERDNAHQVTSPFVGTFYRRPNPDSPEYVKINDKVEKGQVLCIVEAMKLMNEIEADVAGTVVAILAEDGSPVEYGQPLFKIAT